MAAPLVADAGTPQEKFYILGGYSYQYHAVSCPKDTLMYICYITLNTYSSCSVTMEQSTRSRPT